MSYLIGLDIGITSVGYAVLQTDFKGNPYKILLMNTVIFPVAEAPKTGESLAAPVRQKRSSRRTNRRTKFRKFRVQKLFVRFGLLESADITAFLNQKVPHQDIWQLRKDALNRKLSNKELFEILYFFVGHRGFKSNRRSEVTGKQPKDDQVVLTSIDDRGHTLNSFDSLGDMMQQLPEFKAIKHNKNYRPDNTIYPLRAWIEDELSAIFSVQQKNNQQITDDFVAQYRDIFRSQRDFDQGPAAPSRFGGNMIEHMVGPDSLDAHEKRAAKLTNTFFRFNFLSTLNNLKIQSTLGAEFHPLTTPQREIVLQAATLKSLNYKQIRHKLQLPDSARFNLVPYQSNEDFIKTESKHYLFKRKALTQIEAVTDNPQLIDKIGTILAYFKGDKTRQEKLSALNLSRAEIKQLLPINQPGFGNLSLKTMHKILPYLEQGHLYHEAAQLAGYDFQNNMVDRQYLRDNLKNPVVNRAIGKTIKIVNAIINKYGDPDAIHIELTREIKHSHEERQKMARQMNTNMDQNDKIAEHLRENGIPVNGQNIIKSKLFYEQKGIDLYSGQQINEQELYTDDRYQVDHIIPYSISFNDSFTNKTVTRTSNNQNKANRLPLEYLSEEKQADFKTRVIANINNYRKRQNLLKESITEDNRQQWKTRNINDTGYINRLLSQYLRNNVKFTKKSHNPVFTVNGATTAYIRKRYGIIKNRQATDLHHAVDAVIIGCISNTFVSRLAKYSEAQEARYHKKLWQITQYRQEHQDLSTTEYQELIKQFPLPWPDFRHELMARLSTDPAKMMAHHTWEHYTDEEIGQLKPAFVIRTANHKVTGSAHDDTIYSKKLYGQRGVGLLRTPLQNLKYDSKKDSIKNYERLKDGSNALVYDSLLRALKEHDGNAKKAFPDNQLLISTGNHQQIITHVKTVKKITHPIEVNRDTAIAIGGRMIRVDIFKQAKTQKLIGVPVYVNDTVKPTLPNHACTSGKRYSDWYQLTGQDQFLCSLFPNDLVLVKTTSPLKIANNVTKEERQTNKLLCYFSSLAIAGSQIEFHSINGDETINRIVLNKITSITRYQLDYLGNYFPIKHESRKTFNRKR